MSVTAYLLSAKQYGLEKKMNNLSFNIASSNNAGFKARHVMFKPWTQKFFGTRDQSLNEVTYSIQDAEWKDEKHGALKKTENPLQVGIAGQGFFALSDGSYTRNGNLMLTADGVVTTATGIPFVNGDGTEIVINGNPSEIRINYAGQIFDAQNNNLGRFQVVAFEDMNELHYIGDGRVESNVQGAPDSNSRIMQGFIESSNVEAPILMTDAQAAVTDHHYITTMKKNFYDLRYQMTKQLVSTSA